MSIGAEHRFDAILFDLLTALLDWRLTLVVLGVIPLYALTARLRNRALRPAQ